MIVGLVWAPAAIIGGDDGADTICPTVRPGAEGASLSRYSEPGLARGLWPQGLVGDELPPPSKDVLQRLQELSQEGSCLDVNPIAVQRGPGRYHRGFERLDDVPATSLAPEPTPSPTPEPVLSVPEPTPVRTGLEGLICSYSWGCDTSLRVARCESGADLHAESWENWYHRGPFQVSYIHAWRYAARGWDWATASDEQHIAIAYEIQQEQSWTPWLSSGYCWR